MYVLATAVAFVLWDLDQNGSLDLRDLTFAAALIVGITAASTRIARGVRRVRTATRHAIVSAVAAELERSAASVRTELGTLRTDVAARMDGFDHRLTEHRAQLRTELADGIGGLTARMDGFDAKLAGHLDTEETAARDLTTELAAIRALAEEAAGRRPPG